MREKLQILMNAENLTGSRLAEYLGIQPSSISHIMSGRNKPSLDFVQKILQRYPRINPDWLLLDSDQMYRIESTEVATSQNSELLFDDPSAATMSAEQTVYSPANEQSAVTTSNSPAASNPADNYTSLIPPQDRGVKRVIVMFDDHTFESYEPRR